MYHRRTVSLSTQMNTESPFITFSHRFWGWSGTRMLTASQAARNRELSSYSQITLPRRHSKAAARTDCTCICGLPFFKRRKNLFGNLSVAIRTFGNVCWQRPVLKLCQSSSKSGNILRRRWNLILAKHISCGIEL